MPRIVTQFLRFSLVGGLGFVVDVALFNALRITVLAPEALHEGPVLAKVASTLVAIAVNWLGNRHWAFRANHRRPAPREALEFVLVSLGGMVIGVACLWVSHYALGFTSLLADNIASNVVGLALGALFRFWLYRTWVFAPGRADAVHRLPAESAASAPLAEPAAD